MLISFSRRLVSDHVCAVFSARPFQLNVRANIAPETASALAHTIDAASLSSLARIEAADAVQTNGLGSALCSAR